MGAICSWIMKCQWRWGYDATILKTNSPQHTSESLPSPDILDSACAWVTRWRDGTGLVVSVATRGSCDSPGDMLRWSNDVSMLCQRWRRWPSIKPSLDADPMLFESWTSVEDVGPTLRWHGFIAVWPLGAYHTGLQPVPLESIGQTKK